MKMLTKFILPLAMIGAVCVNTVNASTEGKTCAIGTIQSITVGGYNNLHNSSMVVAKINNIQYPLNFSKNLDYKQGMAHLTTLLFAAESGYKVTLRDHFSDNCDDWDELVVNFEF